MKTKLTLTILIILSTLSISGQTTRNRKVEPAPQLPSGTPVIILNDQDPSAVAIGSMQLAIRVCLAHNKHPIMRYSIENNSGELETFEVCMVDYLRVQLELMRNAGVRIDKIKE